MPTKRQPSEAEMQVLAERFKALWREGDTLRPWLRKHQAMLRDLVHDDWSWANLGDALTRAGITWDTGRGWTGERLRKEVVKAEIALKPRTRPLSPSGDAAASSKPQLASMVGADSPTETTPEIARPKAAEPNFIPARTLPAAPQVTHGPAQAVGPSAPKVPRFEAFELKDQEPPRQLTPEEQKEREAIRKRFS